MKKLLIAFLFVIVTCIQAEPTIKQSIEHKKLIYLVSDIRIPFWQILSKGIQTQATNLGYDLEIYTAHNSAKEELVNTVRAIKEKAAGIIVSPTNSSACTTILKLAKQANIPVIIADIGTDAGEYVSYISSNNYDGAYGVGKILSEKMIKKGWKSGRVGIIAIPQTRLNGQQRTAGFLKALDESKIKGTSIKQIKRWSNAESYEFTKEMIAASPNLRAIWIQTSNNYKGVVKALKEMKKEDEIILIAFDAEPEFLELIPKGTILGSGMQQPYLLGTHSVQTMHQHLNGEKIKKEIQLPILHISTDNIAQKIDKIKLNVLGIEADDEN